MMTERDRKVEARTAVEAMRNGVPSREAVRHLGSSQPKAEERFRKMLRDVQGGIGSAAAHDSMLISGDFGSGKSHLLAHFEHIALSGGFVCSRVSISKETPLYDLGKVFVSAMENGRIPERRGRMIEELALSLDPNSDEYVRFSHWADTAADNGQLSKMFPASLVVHEQCGDLELMSDIEAFWAGDRILISKIRTGLRQIDQIQHYRFPAPKAAELPPQRLRFAVELIKSAGYHGWVILLDELELIGSYSILQRGRSYAEVSRWLGLAGSGYSGLIVVAAVTEDFASAIISPDGPKKDRDYMRPKLEQSARHSNLGALADQGMRALERNCLALEPPGDDDVMAAMETLRDLYRQAYDWDPPAYEATAGGAGFRGRMRYKVRAAINEWDLHRLHPEYRPQTEMVDFMNTYAEDTDLENESEVTEG